MSGGKRSVVVLFFRRGGGSNLHFGGGEGRLRSRLFIRSRFSNGGGVQLLVLVAFKTRSSRCFWLRKGPLSTRLENEFIFFSVLETKSENGNIFAMFLIFDFFFLKNKKQNKTKKIKSDTVKMRENPKSSIYQAFFPKGKRGQG